MSQFDTFINDTTKPNISKRYVAGFIDYFIIYAFCFTYVFLYGEPDAEGAYSVSGFPALVPVIFWGIMTVGLEMFSGETLGNLVVGLKATPKNGENRKLTFGESFKRHLLDTIDMFFFGLIAVVTIKNTDKHQRLGDIWANTIVVNSKDLK